MTIQDKSPAPVKVIKHDILKHFTPIKDLTPEDRNQMLNKSQSSDMKKGSELISSEERRWIIYLLDGKMDLLCSDNDFERFAYDHNRASYPVFSEKSHHSRAQAQTDCTIVRFDRQLFATLLEHELITGEELETIEVSDAEGELFNAIMHDFNTGTLKLPGLPEVALKVKTAVANPDVNLVDVAKIIEADPAMAARLIQVVNSPAVMALDKVRSLQDAIVRFGLSMTRNLVMAYAVKQLFKTKSHSLKTRMQQLYKHSVEIAAISYAVAKVSKKFNPDQLLLAGLVHDIGVIPIISYIEETGLEVSDETELDNIIQKLRGIVGSMVIKSWGFTADLLSVVEDAEDWQRSKSDDLDECDIVSIAQLYSLLQHKDISHLPKMNEVPAFKKLFPEQQDPEFYVQVFEQAKEEIAEVKRLLNL